MSEPVFTYHDDGAVEVTDEIGGVAVSAEIPGALDSALKVLYGLGGALIDARVDMEEEWALDNHHDCKCEIVTYGPIEAEIVVSIPHLQWWDIIIPPAAEIAAIVAANSMLTDAANDLLGTSTGELVLPSIDGGAVAEDTTGREECAIQCIKLGKTVVFEATVAVTITVAGLSITANVTVEFQQSLEMEWRRVDDGVYSFDPGTFDSERVWERPSAPLEPPDEPARPPEPGGGAGCPGGVCATTSTSGTESSSSPGQLDDQGSSGVEEWLWHALVTDTTDLNDPFWRGAVRYSVFK